MIQIRLVCLVSLLFLGIAQAQALVSQPASQKDLSLRATFQLSSDALTTERAWELDPSESNPHRRRWLLKREVNLIGLDAFQIAPGKFGVRAQGLDARTTGFVRGPGPWYQELAAFECHPEPLVWFGTQDGSRLAAQTAAKSWERALSDEKFKLSLLLSRITASEPKLATARAITVFNAWLRLMESDWRAMAEQRARNEEWRSYVQLARSSGACPKGRAVAPAPVRWEAMMEPIDVQPEADLRKLLARAPARRWEGLYTIRVTIKIADQSLIGKFLIDSGSGVSVLNPTWLESQGIPPAYVEIPGATPQRVKWTGGEGLAKRAMVDRAEIAGMPIQRKDFLLMETELFNPPKEVGTCCDGILGTDFLKDYVFEFIPSQPPAVNIWARESFALPATTNWIEASVGKLGDLNSSCQVSSGSTRLSGVRWDTGEVSALEIHRPWRAKVASAAGNRWEVRCGNLVIGEGLRPGVPGGVENTPPMSVEYPAATVGVALLSRGSFILDLPHGRIWFPEKVFDKPILTNQSGLKATYTYVKGDRVLKVTQVSPKSAAAALAKEGLKAGATITRIDDRDAAEMDHWEVEQRLAGAYGDKISLEWMPTPKTAKIAELKVR